MRLVSLTANGISLRVFVRFLPKHSEAVALKWGSILGYACDSFIRAATVTALGSIAMEAVWFPEWRDWLAAARSADSGVMLVCCQQELPPKLAAEARARRSDLPLIFVTVHG